MRDVSGMPCSAVFDADLQIPETEGLYELVGRSHALVCVSVSGGVADSGSLYHSHSVGMSESGQVAAA